MPEQSTAPPARPHINPTGVLETIREIIAVLAAADDDGDTAEMVVQGRELAEQMADLDRWLTSGGTLPTPWRQPAE